jgi:hypothetical protein
MARLRELERRYAHELQGLGDVRPGDPGYERLRESREQDIAKILSPSQFERWRTEPPPPVPMPNAPPQGVVTPLPTQDNDSLHHTMPVVKDPQ